MEVKAEANLQAKSLKAYRDKYNPARSVRTSKSRLQGRGVAVEPAAMGGRYAWVSYCC
jgi:hypothetical protein